MGEPWLMDLLVDELSKTIAQDNLRVLEVEGKPKCMAGLTRFLDESVSISHVFTPKDERGHGYASSLVALMSEHILSTGRGKALLYTDLSNPTSNKIYHNIGFRVVAKSWHLQFEP